MWWIPLVLLGLAILLIIVQVSPSFVPTPSTLYKGPKDLGTTDTLFGLTETAPFQQYPSSTFYAFLQLSPMQRTGTVTNCGTRPNQPDCENGVFPSCPCTQGDCTDCAHEGYLNLIDLAGVLRVEMSPFPDAGRQGHAMVQLAVTTESPIDESGNAVDPNGTTNASQKQVETILLPSLPQQKWVMLTIAREGRRFDIQQNNTLVLSKKTLNMVVQQDRNGKGTTSGETGLVGQLVFADLVPFRQSLKDVAQRQAELTDTRGRPVIAVDTVEQSTSGSSLSISGTLPTISMPSFPTISGVGSISVCPNGSCENKPKMRPASPLMDWDTSQA